MSFFAKVNLKKLLLKVMARSKDEPFMLILSLDNRNNLQGVLRLEGHLGISLKYSKTLRQGLWPNTELKSTLGSMPIFKL